MLCRVSCQSCHISCLWTDDPQGFLESVCLRYRHCQAKLINEGFERPLLVRRARAVSSSRMNGSKAGATRSHGKHAAAPH
jgi:hypothetical protein